MNKQLLIIFGLLIVFFSVLVGRAVYQVMDATPQLPKIAKDTNTLHIALITQELDTPFWDRVAQGAKQEAKKQGVAFEVTGAYAFDDSAFLDAMELAIHSKVDGILIQGLDNPRFKELAQVKAAYYGIPIITIANDVPVKDTLRKTYIGTDQVAAGQALGKHALQTLKKGDEVVVSMDEAKPYFERQRLKGLKRAFHRQGIEVIVRTTGHEQQQLVDSTQQLLNEHPTSDAFIMLNANYTNTVVQEISKRMRLSNFQLYTFDDGVDAEALLQSKKINALVTQQPEKMGQQGVKRLVDWLNGNEMPLKVAGYFTSFEIEEVGS